MYQKLMFLGGCKSGVLYAVIKPLVVEMIGFKFIHEEKISL
jgi:hypothetical protein